MARQEAAASVASPPCDARSPGCSAGSRCFGFLRRHREAACCRHRHGSARGRVASQARGVALDRRGARGVRGGESSPSIRPSPRLRIPRSAAAQCTRQRARPSSRCAKPAASAAAPPTGSASENGCGGDEHRRAAGRQVGVVRDRDAGEHRGKADRPCERRIVERMLHAIRRPRQRPAAPSAPRSAGCRRRASRPRSSPQRARP